MGTRLRLRRADGRIYLDRWGVERKWLGGIFLHRMQGPDPGIDLHDHPWAFVSMVIAGGGYLEERLLVRDAPEWARRAEVVEQNRVIQTELRNRNGGMPQEGGFELFPAQSTAPVPRGAAVVRNRFRWRMMRLDECHRITGLVGDRTVWTIVIHGPSRRKWGFYLPEGWMRWEEYDATVRAQRRDMGVEISNVDDERFHFDGPPPAARHWLDRLLFRSIEGA